MTIPENSSLTSKVKRSSELLSIHNLLIFNRSGICIYGNSFTDFFRIEQEQLISSYFTALMAFTKELIGDKIRTLEMGGGVKFVIFEKQDLYYGLLCDIDENIILLEKIISKIHKKFVNFVKKQHIRTDLEYIYDKDLDHLIKDIIKEISSNEFDLEKEEDIIDYLKNLNINNELNDIIFLTDGGKIIYSSAKSKSILRNILKEVDFRVRICNNSILKLFYTSKDNKLIFSEYFNDKYLIIILFDSKTKFGVAEFYLYKIVSKIREILGD